jgi:hypothetical protein
MTEFMDRQIRLQRAGKKEYSEEEVRLIINGAIAEEREACAKVCEALDDGTYAGGDQPYGIHYARAIRARGQQ